MEILRNYCLSKKAASEELPFGPDTLVFKVMGKIFALTGLDAVPLTINLKCEPEKAIALRDEHPKGILPGFHMNKRHWNTVIPEENLSESLIFGLIDHSYDLVVAGLTKKSRQELGNL